ncbi:MAG: hypothetical protein M1830_008906 [Pleopsidium flavum]|nr:MAG: hypothetical protein M1830_008906 [Pleopsidium flavum]
MDAYPPEYVSHNLPLIILSGLGSADSKSQDASQRASYPLLHERGIRITSDIPPVTGSSAEQLLQTFLAADANKGRWNGRHEKGRIGTIGFCVKGVGREYILPPRKADPPPSSPTIRPPPDSPPASSCPAPVLHSPISPLSPGSSTFPDGVMTPQWISKHQELLPSAFVTFFNFTADPNLSSLQDNQVKASVNQLKSVFSSSSYKTRFVAVLCSEKSILEADVDERLTNIRQATRLDSKNSLFFFPPNLSPVETQAFVETVLAALQPACVEYYRELSKHARRKRNRGSVPPPTAPPTFGTSQTLPSQGWNVRYEFKLGVLAEFRQEMDAAGRNYEGAYEGLMGQDVSDTIASWSPRFNEARLLADIIAIRILRCLLWNSQTTSAVQSWENHKARMQDFIDRKGKGSANYGWEAWEARWLQVMAEVIGMADVPVFSVPGIVATDGVKIYAPPERAIPIGVRIRPWELLHHEGYWLNQSTQHTFVRRRLAQEVPEEDRTSPGQSPASQVASKSYTYDTYLCPEPHIESPLPGHNGFDHSAMILKSCKSSVDQFRRRGQGRAVEQLKLQIAREQMRQASWHDAFRTLRALWQELSWRRSGWWELVDEVAWSLRESASHVGDGGSVVSVDWELLNNNFTPRPRWQYNISKCLDGLKSIKSKPAVVLRAGDVASSLSVRFTFLRVEGNVGEPLHYQLVVTSQAHEGSAPVKLSGIGLAFEEILPAVRIEHHTRPAGGLSNAADKVQIQDVALHETSSSADHLSEPSPPSRESQALLVGSADLTFFPGQIKAFTLTSVPRDAGNVKAISCTLSMEEQLFDLAYIVVFGDDQIQASWWTRGKSGLAERRLGHDQSASINILPRPPKIEIQLPNARSEYYTDESVVVDVHIVNNEEEEAEAAIEVRLLGQSEGTPELTWGPASTTKPHGKFALSSSNDRGGQTTHLSRRVIGRLAPAATSAETVSFRAKSNPARFVLEIKILYHLASEPHIPMSRIVTSDLIFMGPFEANYDFSPRLHTDQWPSFFWLEDELTPGLENSLVKSADGIAQTWCLTARPASFATELLTIEAMDVSVLEINGGITVNVRSEEQHGWAELSIGPNEQKEVRFTLDVRKLTLEDRRSASLDLALNIRWRRVHSASELNETSLSVPRLLVPGGEPRVLAVHYQVQGLPALIHLDYVFENPSMHFLTFSLAMEASEAFAFSGPKVTSLQLAPLSRHTVRYNLLPYTKGTWIQPQLKVVDMYFNKLLRISATEGMKSDKKGILIWADADA